MRARKDRRLIKQCEYRIYATSISGIKKEKRDSLQFSKSQKSDDSNID